MASKLYDEKSIESISPREFVRLRPQVYCGDTADATQLLIEVISNSIDEFRAGHGDCIEVFLYKDGRVKVRDYGQGFIPNLMREDGKTVLEAAFSVLNTSGKYREDGTYEGTSLGSYGIGLKLVTFLSTWLHATTFRGNKVESIKFIDGEFSERKVENIKCPSGTEIEWFPSEEFFTDIHVNMDRIDKLFHVVSCLCPGLSIVLRRGTDESNLLEEKTYRSENGLDDLVDQATKGSEILKNRFSINFEDGKYKLDLVATYLDSYSTTIVPYVNTGLTESGLHITQIKTLLTREMNKFFREKGWIKENLSGDDCQEGLYLVFNITAPNVAYDAQIKARITKIDMQPFSKVIAEEFQYWLSANEKEVKLIADKASRARKAREAARKAREAARETKGKKSSKLQSKIQLSTKFINCGNTDPKHRNLMLVEGTSAAASAVEARNPKRDAIYMLRGKIISPLRTSIEKILANQEMHDIIEVIGAGFGQHFDVSKTQFDKIIITVDQDSDGNFRCLLHPFLIYYKGFKFSVFSD